MATLGVFTKIAQNSEFKNYECKQEVELEWQEVEFTES